MMTYTEEDAMYWVEFTPIYMTRENKKTIKENCIKVLDTLNKCNCCPRHKINRISVEDYEKGATGDFPDKNTHLYVKMRCECDCRHLTRIICHRLRELDEN